MFIGALRAWQCTSESSSSSPGSSLDAHNNADIDQRSSQSTCIQSEFQFLIRRSEQVRNGVLLERNTCPMCVSAIYNLAGPPAVKMYDRSRTIIYIYRE